MSAQGTGTSSADGILTSSIERSSLWRLKLYLQFTGWLLFLLNAALALAFLLVAGLGWLLSGSSSALFVLPFGLGAALLTNLVFDIGTVKWDLRPFDRRPKRLDDLDVFDLMRARNSCRSYQARDLTPEHRTELLEAVERYRRSALQLSDRPFRIEYVAAPLTVWPTLGAREFLVAIAPQKYNRLAVIDVARSLQKVVLHATRMGLGTCWIGPGADQKSVIAHLGDRFNPDEDHVICVCVVGYASWFKPLSLRFMNCFMHRRRPLTSLFFADPSFTAPLDVQAPPFSDYGRCYEVCQWAPSSYNSQTTRCAAVTETVGGQQRIIRFDFGATTTSRYYAAVAVGIWLANWETGCQALGRRGRFAVLTPDERGAPDPPDGPRYDVSWIVQSTSGQEGASSSG